MKILSNFLLLFAVIFYCSCSSATQIKKTQTKTSHLFNSTIVTRRPFEVKYADKTNVMIPNAIPNSSMTYLKYGKKFRADYTMIINFYKNRNLIFNETFSGFREVDTFKETKNNLIYLSTFNILITPGKYNIEIYYQSDAQHAIIRYENVEIPDYNKFSIGSLHLLKYNGQIEKNGKLFDNFITNYNRICIDEDSLYFLTELYNIKQGLFRFKFDFYKGNEIIKTVFNEIIHYTDADIYEIIHPIALQIDDLESGDYLLKVEISDNFNNRATTEIDFYKTEDIIKYTNKEWKNSLKLLSYMIGRREISQLEELETVRERKIALYNLWRERDAGENLYVTKAIFYQRVRFVNLRYGTKFYPGWKTDRGRIYIKYGMPDNINQNPMSLYELWTYFRIDRIFVFVDRSRIGISYNLERVYNLRGNYLGLHEDPY